MRGVFIGGGKGRRNSDYEIKEKGYNGKKERKGGKCSYREAGRQAGIKKKVRTAIFSLFVVACCQ